MQAGYRCAATILVPHGPEKDAVVAGSKAQWGGPSWTSSVASRLSRWALT